MTTKLLLLALSSAGGLFVGLFFSNVLKSKRDFFGELMSFIDSVTSDITFRQDGVQKVACVFQLNCKSKLKGVLEQYVAAPQQYPAMSFLSKGEKQIVGDFFLHLGKSDILTEKSELENAKRKIGELSVLYKTKCAKQGSMYIKLGLLAGLAVGILML